MKKNEFDYYYSDRSQIDRHELNVNRPQKAYLSIWGEVEREPNII